MTEAKEIQKTPSEAIVVITGGGSGLGARLAKKYSEDGALVVLIGRTQKKLSLTAEQLPGPAYTFSGDLSDPDQTKQIFDRISHHIGPVDILINSAGVGFFAPAEDIPPGKTCQMIDANLKATIFCTQQVLKPMRQRNRGQIVNIISMSGKRAKAEESVYCATKFGIDGFTKAVRLELENTNVKVTGIYMGNMATELWKDDKPEDFDRFIRPEDMADIVFDVVKPRNFLSMDEITVRNAK
ncbi:MAG: SDR family NAD(P)-dependent oxidoreductase [Eubacteriales bacterium]|nr:SDR family NAD(P)-dependent oxidoreductase [Eubacteriales bacterium]